MDAEITTANEAIALIKEQLETLRSDGGLNVEENLAEAKIQLVTEEVKRSDVYQTIDDGYDLASKAELDGEEPPFGLPAKWWLELSDALDAAELYQGRIEVDTGGLLLES